MRVGVKVGVRVRVRVGVGVRVRVRVGARVGARVREELVASRVGACDEWLRKASISPSAAGLALG